MKKIVKTNDDLSQIIHFDEKTYDDLIVGTLVFEVIQAQDSRRLVGIR